MGKQIAEGIQMEPSMKGLWRWASDNTLTFLPKEDWAVGQSYTVKLDRELFPKHVRLEKYKLNFMSAQFSVSLKETMFYQDPRDPKTKRVVVTASFSHPVDAERFEKNFQMEYELRTRTKKKIVSTKEPYPFTISYDEFKGEAYIHSDIIKIPMEESEMFIQIKKGVRAAAGGPEFSNELKSSVKIPGMYSYFRVNSLDARIVRNEKYEAEQVLILEMTTGVLEAEIQNNISAYLLPVNRPPVPGDERVKKNFNWRDVNIIGPEILNASKKVKLNPIPTDRDFASTHSFKFEAPADRTIYFKLNQGIQSYGGYILAKEYDKLIRVPRFQKELKIMHDGAILSLTGDKTLSVLSNGVEAIRVSFYRVLPKQINHLVSQTRGHFRSPQFKNYHFNESNISEVFTKEYIIGKSDRPRTEYTAVDFSEYHNAAVSNTQGLFFMKVESWDPVHKRTTGMQDKRLVLITDMGLLVKEEKDGSRRVFVQSISNGNPVQNVKVEVIGRNGLPIVTKYAGESGNVSFLPLANDFKNEKEPTAIIAKKSGDLSFIPYEWQERRLNFSRFDVGGVHTSLSASQLQAYLFSDRGIYRPGDEIRAAFIVKRADWKAELQGIPLETVVIDPRGLEISKRRIRLAATGFEEMKYITDENSPTGKYQFSVYIVKDNRRAGLLGSVAVKVEEFLPDRMKINTRFSEKRENGWVSPGNLKGLVSLRNLFGAVAENRKVAAEMMINPQMPRFKAYDDYVFIDINRKRKEKIKRFSERLEDKTTDENGEVEYELNLNRFDKAYYRLNFLARGFEAKGGRSVSSESSILVSDFNYLIGYKTDGSLGYIKRGANRNINIIAIDSKLNKVSASDLTLSYVRLQYVSSLLKQRNGVYKYQSIEREVTISTKTFSIPSSGLNYNMPSEKAGNYIITVKNNEDIELLRVRFSIIGEANLTRSLERNAELQVKLDKQDYSVGENIELQITAPYKGAGVITIEQDKVYAYKWFKTYKTNTIQRIKVPSGLEGNGYVNVSFVRSLDSDEVFMSPLSYAAIPFSVSLEKRTSKIELDIPEKIKPGEEYKIRYRSKRTGKAVIYAVDEGILQVANYKTPDPLSKFFEKRALEVRTSQIVDLILPEYRIIQEIFSKSGGSDRDALSKNLNPFKRKRHKPVAFWSGIVDVKSEWNTVSFQLPDYFNGTVRVMAVAVSDDKIGVSEKKGLVKGPFVLSPNVPTFVAPGDEFEVSVGVFNNVEGSGVDSKVKLKLETSAQLEVIGEKEMFMNISENKEGVGLFKIKANRILGSANFTFRASDDTANSKYSIDLSVRPPIPYMTDIKGGYLKQKGKAELGVTRKMYPHFRVLEAAASTVPIGLAHGLKVYLNRYPYHGTEQLVSKTIPAIILKKYPEFGYKSGDIFDRTLKIVQSRQNSDGAFGFYAANSHVSPFQSVYTLHFMLEAQEAGINVPKIVLQRGRNYLRKLAGMNTDTLSDCRVKAYAIYVLTRYHEVTTNNANNLKSWLQHNYKKEWKTDLTTILLAAVYKMHNMDNFAQELISKCKLGDRQEVDYNNFYDGLLRDSFYLYIVSKHFPDRIKTIKGDDLLYIVDPIVNGRFNTLTAALTIMGLGAYIDHVGYPESSNIQLNEVDLSQKETPLKLSSKLFAKAEYTEKAEKINIKNLDDYTLFYQITQAGFDYDVPQKEIKDKLEIYREYRKPEGSKINKIKVGEEFEVHLSIRSLDGNRHSNIAVIDLLPGGFEIVNNSGNTPVRNVRMAVGGSTWDAHYCDVREDRVVLYGNISPEVKKIVYKVRATNKGNYVVPPPYGESMYNQGIRCRGVASEFEITD
ncbi:alpha-2-macroglobulin [Elusimicrobiota bacterium]